MGDRDDKTTEALGTLSEAPSASYRLVVCAGPDKGASIVLDARTPSRVLVGQSRACELVLHDPKVSRRHAAFDLVADGVSVIDLDSMNGTRVNGVRITEATLEGGEVVQLGQTALRLDVAAERMPVPVSLNAGFGRLVGASMAMRRLYPLCERIALGNGPVIIEGETGTGKELLAEALHEIGPRKAKPFVVFDCTGTPREAAVPLLFGDGLPEGASFVEQADGGTLLIDEIADLSEEAQARLLRLLDHGEVRIEGRTRIRADVRVLAATRRDLEREVQAARFRDDLYYRLAAVRVELPPLRERHGDIELLAAVFWRRGASGRPVPPDLLTRYEQYRWPGNIRELENAVARRISLGPFVSSVKDGPRDDAGRIHDAIDRILARNLPLAAARAELIDEFERRYVARVLSAHGGNLSRAAMASGVARRYFQILRARHAK
jgi:DNA-binding NtrC family response regulator